MSFIESIRYYRTYFRRFYKRGTRTYKLQEAEPPIPSSAILIAYSCSIQCIEMIFTYLLELILISDQLFMYSL